MADQPDPIEAALGEALERYCGNLVASSISASHAELIAVGRSAVHPGDLALFSDAQHARLGFPFRRFTPDLQVDWAVGHDLLTGEEMLVPASLVWASYPFVAAEQGGVITHPVYQPGLAAGQSRTHAALAGMLEVIERDAMVLGWHGGSRLVPIDPPPWLARLARGPNGVFDTRFVSFPNPFGVIVAGALVCDRHAEYLTLGLAARFDQRGALLKAYAEALQLQRFVAGLDDPEGAYVSRLDATSPLKPWCRDRRYLDVYASDLSDATDDVCNLQLHLDPRMQRRFETEFAAALAAEPRNARAADSLGLPSDDLAGTVVRLAHRMTRELGRRPVVVDLTTADVLATGTPARVVRVIAPGAYANASLAYPFLGGTRFASSIERTGGSRITPLPH